MKKAYFVPLEKKNERQVLEDISLTPQERVWRMFDLMEALYFFKKEKTEEVIEGMTYVTLRPVQKNGQLS